MAETGPIFIHSLFRCASTFFFQKFRTLGADFTCYQEPLNESLEALNRPARHARLLASPEDSLLRHPALDKPYFYEFWLRRQQLQGLYRRAFAYDEYFTGTLLPSLQQRWLSALLEHARGRAILQFCRSSGRAPAIRSIYGGVHLHLWREPRAQWWSYKVGDYFDSVSRRIYQAHHVPAPLAQLAEDIIGLRSGERPLPPQANYALFYGLWLDAWLRLGALADVSISVDQIAVCPADNRACAHRLAGLVGKAIDLSDIRASGMAFMPEELDFYERIEATVDARFVRTGHANSALVESAGEAAARARGAHARRAHAAPSERNLRQAALAMMERLAGTSMAQRRRWQATPTDPPEITLLRPRRRLWAARSIGTDSDSPPLSAVITQAARDGYHRG